MPSAENSNSFSPAGEPGPGRAAAAKQQHQQACAHPAPEFLEGLIHKQAHLTSGKLSSGSGVALRGGTRIGGSRGEAAGMEVAGG